MITKTELDINVSHELGISQRRVAEITAAFIDEIRNGIVEKGGVHIQGLGKLVTKMEIGSRNVGDGRETMRIKLYFSKSSRLKAQIEKKYGINIKKERSNGKQ